MSNLKETIMSFQKDMDSALVAQVVIGGLFFTFVLIATPVSFIDILTPVLGYIGFWWLISKLLSPKDD